MRSSDFWDYFDRVAKPRLALRANTFSSMFTYLDGFDRPVGIVETGCIRESDAWEGDGQSTILFDKYAATHPGSIVLSIDNDPAATSLCRSLVTPATRIHTGDSLDFLQSLTGHPPRELQRIDLLYLDSLDVDFEDYWPSAAHHLKELLAIMPLLRSDTLIVVDDSPLEFLAVPIGNGDIKRISAPRIGGKGRLIAEYAVTVGAESRFAEYQCGWTGFRGDSLAPATITPSRRAENGLADHPPNNAIPEALMARGDLQVAEVRAIMTWLRSHPRLAGILKRANRLGAGWRGHR